jgi:hypothetical protein
MRTVDRAFRAGAEFADGSLERPIIAPRKDNAKPLGEQLPACLEPQAAVRAGDERDASADGCHRRIVVSGGSSCVGGVVASVR